MTPATPDNPDTPSARNGEDATPTGPVSAVAYVCASTDPASAALYTAWCRQRAAAAGWTLDQIVTDPDNLTPLIERPGWQRITQLLTHGGLAAVITVNRQMIADSPAAWARLTDLLQGLGAVLVTTSSSPIPGRSHEAAS
jgi:hypothetical protein